MKTMTCQQPGGPCDLELRGETADEVIVAQDKSAAKMKTRFNTIGFSDSAALDNATMWPTSFAVLEWNAGNEEQLRALVKKAVS